MKVYDSKDRLFDMGSYYLLTLIVEKGFYLVLLLVGLKMLASSVNGLFDVLRGLL